LYDPPAPLYFEELNATYKQDLFLSSTVDFVAYFLAQIETKKTNLFFNGFENGFSYKLPSIFNDQNQAKLQTLIKNERRLEE